MLERVVDGDAGLQASKNQNKQETNQADDFAMLGFRKLTCGPAKRKLQWGSEYRQFEYRKHLDTELFEVRISKGCLCLQFL